MSILDEPVVKIYSVGVWNTCVIQYSWPYFKLKFTPLEFETIHKSALLCRAIALKFTPLEFETSQCIALAPQEAKVKIYSVGVWNIWQGGALLRARYVKIYSVGVWNQKGEDDDVRLPEALKFTPLEFETCHFHRHLNHRQDLELKFTPLEFETR